MKLIIKNRYLKVFRFSSLQEMLFFLKNQEVKNHLSIGDSFGDNHYCYICYHSLTKQKQFILSFSSDETEDSLNFLLWNEQNMLVLDTGKKIYLIDSNLSIWSSFEITTPLIGLYLINTDKLLILEEAFMRVVDYNGKILKSELFDLIDDFNITDSLLSIRTGEQSITFEL